MVNLKTVVAGQVGRQPALATLFTDNTIAQVTVAGFLNAIGGQSYNLNDGDYVFAQCSDGNYPLVCNIAANGEITLVKQNIDDAVFANTGLKVLDSDGSNYLTIRPGSNLTANRTFTITTGNADRNLDLSASGDVDFTAWGASLVNDADATAGRSTLNIFTAETANIGGAGAGPIDVTVSGMAATDYVIPVIKSSTNTVAIAKCITATNKFTVTFTADPGASCVLRYIRLV